MKLHSFKKKLLFMHKFICHDLTKDKRTKTVVGYEERGHNVNVQKMVGENLDIKSLHRYRF